MKHGSIITPRPPGLPHLSHRATAVLPAPVNWFKKSADGNMLGNDQYGDCDPAADFRIIQLWGGACTQTLALARYTQLTGFDAAIPSTDQGTDTNQDMKAWCSFPIFDGQNSWPIYWAQIDGSDLDQVGRALTRFPLLITFLLPVAIADKPELWAGSVGTGPAWVPSEGHRVVLGGWTGTNWIVRTWGMDVLVSPAIMALMLAVVDVPIPHPLAAPDELNLDGIAFDALAADLEQLKLV